MATVNKTTVTDIYTGVLGLLPPQSAIDWLTSAEYAGKPLDVAANLVLDAFHNRYSAGVDDANLLPTASNENFVKAVYARIFGLTVNELAAQAEGVTYWTNWLKNLPAGADHTNNGRGSLISTMLDVALDKNQYVGEPTVTKARALLANREAVSEHYLQKGGADADQSWLRQVIGEVTENSNSVASAKTVIDSIVVELDSDDDDYLDLSWIDDLGGHLVRTGDQTYRLTYQGEVVIFDAEGQYNDNWLEDVYNLQPEDLILKHSGNNLVLTTNGNLGSVTVVDFYKKGHISEYLDWFADDIEILNLVGAANSLANGASISDLSGYIDF
jgi:hypothetical protein